MGDFIAGIVVLLYMATVLLAIKFFRFIVDWLFKYIPRIWKRQFNLLAGMAKSEYAADLKSVAEKRVGSNPTTSTKANNNKHEFGNKKTGGV